MHASPATFDELARLEAAKIVDQLWLDFLLPYGPGRVTLRPHEVAAALGYKSVNSVYAEVERAGTWLEVMRRPGLERQELLITRRSVLLTLARMSMEGGAKLPLFMERVKSLLTALNRAQLGEVIAEAMKLKGAR